MSDAKGELFIKSVLKGDLQRVKQYLDSGGDPEFTDHLNGVTALSLAITENLTEIATELVKRGADTNGKSKTGLTCIHCACVMGNDRILKVMLEHGVKDLDSQWNDGVTPLYLAAQENHPRCVELLLLHGSNPLKEVRFSRKDILYPSDVAVTFGHAGCVNQFLMWCHRLGPYAVDKVELPAHSPDAKVNLVRNITDNMENLAGMALKKELGSVLQVEDDLRNFLLQTETGALNDQTKFEDVNRTTMMGMTALHLASLNGKLDNIHYLLAHGARVNVQTKTGFTPLYLAAYGGYKDIVNLLLKAGADPCLGHQCGLAPLGIALCKEHSEVIASILGQCPGAMPVSDINMFYIGDQAEKRLCLAATDGDMSTVLKCIDELGVDVNKTLAMQGERPIHIACQYGHTAIVKELLKRNARLDFVTKRHLTPLHCSAMCGSVETMEILLEHKVDINQQAEGGMTTLMIAAQGNYSKMVEELLKRGADPALSTPKGYTCADIAHLMKWTDVINTIMYWCYQSGPFQGHSDLCYNEDTAETLQKVLTTIGEKAMFEQIEEIELVQKLKNDKHRQALEEALMGNVEFFQQRPSLAELCVSAARNLTPLHCACFQGCVDTVKYLVQCKVNVNRQTKEGFTALYLAAQQGHVKVVQLMLSCGADPNIYSKIGLTPVGIAMYTRQKDVIDTILYHTPDIPPISPNGTFYQRTSQPDSKCVIS